MRPLFTYRCFASQCRMASSPLQNQEDLHVPPDPNGDAEDDQGGAAPEGSPRAGDLDAEEMGHDPAERVVYSWGQNAYSELGHGDSVERALPTPIEFFRGKELVGCCAGNEHTAVVTADGHVYTCGYNDSGQCGVGSTRRVSHFERVEALANKHVVLVASSNGCEHTCAVTDEGELFTFGYSSRGQTGHGTTSAILSPRLVESLLGHRVTLVACSYYHTIVATDSDRVFSFGRGDFGQLGVGDTQDRPYPTAVEDLTGRGVRSLAAGQYHSVATLSDGGILSWGKNDYGQLGVGSSAARLRPGLVGAPLEALTVAVSVACGYYHTAVVVAGGALFTFGRNDYGQLGLGNRENGWRPQLVKNVEGAEQVACGCYHTLVLCRDGTVKSFGRGNHGQLGVGPNTDLPRPSTVGVLKGRSVLSLRAGFYHSLCICGPRLLQGRDVARRTLASDLRQLLSQPRRSDVTFIVEGRRIDAHRCLLLARCEPLANMLDGPMREATAGEVEIPDVGYEVFRAFLEWIYTDEVMALRSPRVELSFALDLLSLADQYLVDALKRKAEAAITHSISLDNVSLMLAAADARQAVDLKRRCLEFIFSHFQGVIVTKSFVELPTHLLQEVLQEAAHRGVSVGARP